MLSLAALTVHAAPVYSATGPDKRKEEALLDTFRQLTEPMHQLDWDKEYLFIKRALDNVWQRNGWTDEPDRYARNLACEVAAIPPWQPIERLNLLNERVAERYGLTEDQANRFRNAVMGETAGFLMRNFGMILEQTQEGLQARIRGEPFTAEQVAEWAKEGQPLLLDMHKTADRLTKELEPMVQPGKRPILERDRRSFEKRRRFTDKMFARWAQGQWEPADWGLEDDPVQTGSTREPRQEPAHSARKPPSAAHEPRPAKLPRWVAHEPSTWFAYVVEFQKRFGLNPGQMTTAESIHVELLEHHQSLHRISRRHAETRPRSRACHP